MTPKDKQLELELLLATESSVKYLRQNLPQEDLQQLESIYLGRTFAETLMHNLAHNVLSKAPWEVTVALCTKHLIDTPDAPEEVYHVFSQYYRNFGFIEPNEAIPILEKGVEVHPESLMLKVDLAMEYNFELIDAFKNNDLNNTISYARKVIQTLDGVNAVDENYKSEHCIQVKGYALRKGIMAFEIKGKNPQQFINEFNYEVN